MTTYTTNHITSLKAHLTQKIQGLKREADDLDTRVASTAISALENQKKQTEIRQEIARIKRELNELNLGDSPREPYLPTAPRTDLLRERPPVIDPTPPGTPHRAHSARDPSFPVQPHRRSVSLDPDESHFLPERRFPPATVTLVEEDTANQSKTFLSYFEWAGRMYKIEQTLPSSTSELEWEAIASGYKEILTHSPLTTQASEIKKLELALDTASGEMRISFPKSDDPRIPSQPPFTIQSADSPIVQRLLDYIQTKDEGFLVPFMSYDPLPREEPTQTLPTPFANPTGTNCALNSWLSLVETNPLLRTQYRRGLHFAETTSVNGSDLPDATALNRRLFPPRDGILRQQDAMETAAKFMERFGTPDALLQYRIERTYRPQTATNEEQDFPLVHEQNSLPVLSVLPDGRSKDLSQIFEEQLLNERTGNGDPVSLEGNPVSIVKEQHLGFDRAPNTLVFHAQRTNGSPNKNMGEIELSERMKFPGSFFDEENDPRYQLRGFIVHFSAQRPDNTFSPYDGHYISYVKIKGEDGKTHYYELDDATKIGPDNALVLSENPQREISREVFLQAAKQFTVAVYNKLEERPQVSFPEEHLADFPSRPEAPIRRGAALSRVGILSSSDDDSDDDPTLSDTD